MPEQGAFPEHAVSWVGILCDFLCTSIMLEALAKQEEHLILPPGCFSNLLQAGMITCLTSN
jgi:hypothetical protein